MELAGREHMIHIIMELPAMVAVPAVVPEVRHVKDFVAPNIATYATIESVLTARQDMIQVNVMLQVEPMRN